jgi:hypothetical protein
MIRKGRFIDLRRSPRGKRCRWVCIAPADTSSAKAFCFVVALQIIMSAADRVLIEKRQTPYKKIRQFLEKATELPHGTSGMNTRRNKRASFAVRSAVLSEQLNLAWLQPIH